jgi:SAM-dependent methyltransferase
MTDSEIFDRKLRRARRDRAALKSIGESRFMKFCADDLLERIDTITKLFSNALVINGAATSLIAGLLKRGMTVEVADPGVIYAQSGKQFDEDMAALSRAQYDLIISVGLLDTVNDLPGALLLLRRTLEQGGLFLAQCAGAGSLTTLRMLLRDIDPAVQHTHPMIDVRAAGDLLARAGFALPVADSDTHQLKYDSFKTLLSDLRAHASTNVLQQRKSMPRDHYVKLIEAFASTPITETLSIITLTGWAPPLE